MHLVPDEHRQSLSSASASPSSLPAHHDDVQNAIANVQKTAQADTTKSGQAHADFLEAIRQLNLVAETPRETLMRVRFEPTQLAAIRLTLEIGALDAIVEKHGERVTAQELGDITGYDALLIERAMRQVTWCGICEEASEATYAATPTTQLMVSPGGAGGLKHIYDLFFPVAANLMPYLHETKIHQFPTPPQKTAFEHVHGMNLWDFMAQNPTHRKSFDDYMATRREGIQAWYSTFPISTELFPGAVTDSESVLLVDIGGNLGHEAGAFHSAHPTHPGRIILQDLPSMIEEVNRRGAPEGVEPMPYDFLTPQPVHGARAYYLRSVLHDWDDASCERILSNTVRAMKPGYSRLLLDEYVLPNTNVPIRGSSLDFLMMMFCGAMERTERQWQGLLHRCGLEIVKVWGGRSDYEQIVEAKLKE